MSRKGLMLIEKEGFLKKIINAIKAFFKRKDKNSIKGYENPTPEQINNDERDEFLECLKVDVDFETLSLKVKLDNGEIRAIDLTDEQIEKLQKIYDKEIQEKKIKLAKLKNSA